MKYILSLGFMLMTMMLTAQSSPVGFWKTVDDNTGETRSVMEVYMNGDKVEGKIHQLLNEDPNMTCDLCPGDKKDAKLVGMVIMYDLEQDGDEWEGGKIMDPENGKTYKCYIELEGNDKLKVRGYIGFRAVGRTQYWYRDTTK